jgi:hypothetical protein
MGESAGSKENEQVRACIRQNLMESSYMGWVEVVSDVLRVTIESEER